MQFNKKIVVTLYPYSPTPTMVTSVQHPSTIFIYIFYIYLYSGPLDFFFLSFRQVWAVQKLIEIQPCHENSDNQKFFLISVIAGAAGFPSGHTAEGRRDI